MELFKKTGLDENILKAIKEMGFEVPTPIQEKTIPAILKSKKDLVGLAQTGTGKTAGFGLPIIQLATPGVKIVQALILCPTRELCLQITKELVRFSKYTQKLSVAAVYGGADISKQIKELRDGVQIVVGTPGRTLDLIKRKVLKVENIEWLVLDEADEMLNMGFKEDLDAILQGTPSEKQTLLFSATMPKAVMQIAENFMHDPDEISIGKRNMGAENVEHHFYMVKAVDRYIALKRIADLIPDVYGIVFCRTRQETKDVANKLMHDGYNADALHGDLSQAQRDQVMQRFRLKHLQLLIATDVAARGIDVNDLTHIINYNLPDDPEIYIHRSGRTGRAGKKGISIAIIHSRENLKLRDIERLARIKFEHKLIPGGREICEKRLFSLINRMEMVEVDNEQINPFLKDVFQKLEWMDREELIKRFVSVEFNRFLEYYKDARDLNISKDDRREVQNSDNHRKNSSKGFSRFYINLGSKNDIKTHNIIGIINDFTSTKNIEIGKIEILKNFSFFEADKSFESKILQSLNNAVHDNITLKVELSTPKKEGRKDSEGGYTSRKNPKYSKTRFKGNKNKGKRRPRNG